MSELTRRAARGSARRGSAGSGMLLVVVLGCSAEGAIGQKTTHAGSPAKERASAEPEPSPASVMPVSPITYPWQPDRGDGTYENPVIYADYSDPDVIRVGDDYFMVASSFNCTPGLPILRSPDLVNWTIIGHALENLPDARYEEVRHGEGMWAPSLREHDRTSYLFVATPDEGIYVLTAPHPQGPWSKPRMLLEGKGLIDPSALWDDDGKAYLVHAYARSRAGIRDRLRVRPMTPDASQVLSEGRIVFHEPSLQPTLEGPKFYKRDGWYYILAPAGGAPSGWQVALRSRDVYGPYEDRIVLERSGTAINGPHQGGLVDSPDGRSWFLHFQDTGLYGRVVHLNPVRWQGGWPMMGKEEPETGARIPVSMHDKPVAQQPLAVPQTSDEFDDERLGAQWQWHANHDDAWLSLSQRPGFLRLFAQPDRDGGFLEVPNLLMQKLPARTFTFHTELHPKNLTAGTSAGLVVMGLRHAALSVQRAGSQLQLVLLDHGVPISAAPLAEAPVRLSVTMLDGGYSQFAYETASVKRRVLPHGFQAEPGRWIGAKVGLFATHAGKAGGFADFSYARFAPPVLAGLTAPDGAEAAADPMWAQ